MRKLIACAVVCLSFLVAMPLVKAQTAEGTITGTVFDAGGAVIPNATVTITNEGTNISTKKSTGPDGAYRFDLVPPGTYKVSAKAANFAEKIQKGVVVRTSQYVPLNFTLELAGTQTVVEVTSAPALVQTATSDEAHTVDDSTIMNTPLLSRDVYSLIFTAPQVVPGMDTMAASSGVRESGTTIMLNGSDNNDNFSEGSVNITPPLESVQEFTILTNQMSAQYGHAAGALVSVEQKSGTNNLHGALYEFNRNRSFNASDFFQNRIQAPKPKYIRNQFGGEIGGPIVKNKTFFMAAVDEITLRTGAHTSTSVPTASLLSQMQAATASSPIATYYLTKYPPITSSTPCPNEPASAIGSIGCAFFFDPVSSPVHTFVGRVDHNFSDKDRVTFTANIFRNDFNDKYGGGYPSAVPISFVDQEHYHNLTIVETHTFGPSLYNEATIAHNRHLSKGLEGGGKNVDPYLAIDGADYGNTGFAFGPFEGGLVLGFVQDRWQWQDNVGWQKGPHSFKFGGSLQFAILYRNWDLGLPGFYEFGNVLPANVNDFVGTGSDGKQEVIGSGVTAPTGYGTPTCPELTPTVDSTTSPNTITAWNCTPSVLNSDGSIGPPAGVLGDTFAANFVNEFPYFQEMSIDPSTGATASAYRHYLSYDSGLFVNDDWKITPRLTLNLGLRWERYGAPREEHNILAQFQNFNCISSTDTVGCIRNARIGPAAAMWNTRNLDLGPRVGFAWDIFGNGKTSVRGGYGIFYDRIFDNVWSNGAWNPPFYALIDWDNTGGDTIFYNRPPIPSPTYTPGPPPDFVPFRVSVRTMENNLKDSSVQSLYLGVERQLTSNTVLRVNYQASLGRHLSVLMNWNRYDGDAYNSGLTRRRPNTHYTGFNYRSNNVTSNYNGLVTEIQKRYGKGLYFSGGYTWGKLMDFGSDLFSGSTLTGQFSQPYYYISNNHKNLEKGPGAFDHRHAFKLNANYELPFLRDQKSLLGKIAGGWQLSGFYQVYSGHPIEVFNSRTRFRARDANGNLVLDSNGLPYNIGGDYNLDGVNNDHPDFVGTSVNGVYSNGNPADGVFTDNNPIGCGTPDQPSTVANTGACNDVFGVTTPNKLFINPPGFGIRYGRLGRNVFHGPWFNGFDAGLFKNFQVNERNKLQFRFEALNVPNHPNFDGIITDLSSVGNFAKAQILVGEAPARRIQLGLRWLF